MGELSTQRGDGVFETIGVIDGHAQEVTPHLERLANSARICDLPMPNQEQWRQAVSRGWSPAECRAGEGAWQADPQQGVERGPPTAWVVGGPGPDCSAVRASGVRVVTLDRGLRLRRR